MTPRDDEDELLRSVAAQNARSIVQARRQLEDELRQQAEWTRVTLASIGDGVISTDADGRVTYLNGVAEALTGWSMSEALNRSLPEIFQIINEETREPVEDPALRAIGEGEIIGLTNHTLLVARDGTERPIDDSAAPIRDDQGRTIGVVLVFRDVSDRRKTERALTRSELELADFFENASVGLRWTGPDGIIQRVNQHELDMFGYEREEYVGHHLAEFHVDANVVENFLSRLRRGETIREFPSQVRCKDGSVRDVLINSNVLFEDGEFVHTRSFTLDITDRKRAEASGRQNEGRLRFILDSMPDKVFTAGATGEADYFNPQWSAFTGLPPAEMKGWNWTQIVHGDDLPETLRIWQNSLDTGHEYYCEHRLRSWDGEFRWHISRASAFRDEHDRISMWVGNSADIHEQKEIARKLRRLAADLSEADRRKNEFLAMLAHELRNPLAPLRNAAEVLKLSGGGSESVRFASEMMERQIDQLVRLVDDLLDVNRISQGKIELRIERVDLGALVRQTAENCRSAVDAGRFELTITLPDEPIYLQADPIRLSQALSNLLNNACKFTEPEGHIAIKVRKEETCALVSIKDDGEGIPPDMRSSIFDMFSQVKSTNERANSGLGIGLALVKNLIELHGGTIEVRSEGVGHGSEFVLRLPLAAGESVHVPASTKVAAAPAPSRRVLVVDDNRDSAHTLSVLLNLEGHETETAFDGVEALEAVARFVPEVVLLDIGLPRRDGYEAAREIRERWGDTVVLVALTGWGQPADRERSLAAGFDHHLVKPIEHEALLRVLAELPRKL
jgi:PAS domain S-box-containing protein